MAAASPGTLASVISRNTSVSIDNRSSEVFARSRVAAVSHSDATGRHQVEIAPAWLNRNGTGLGARVGPMDRLFDVFGHIAEIGIAGLTIAGAPSGRWSSSAAKNGSIATSTSKRIRARPSSSRTSMRAFRISERQFERYKALSILMEP